jgi:hypothetical protein
MVKALFQRLLAGPAQPQLLQGWQAATDYWRASQRHDGLLPHTGLQTEAPSIEASAAMVQGLYRWGFAYEAQQITDGLIRLQSPEGHWQSNTWLTGAALTGLMADMKQALMQGRSFRAVTERAFLSGCDWIYHNSIQPDGRILHGTARTWFGHDKQRPIPEAVLLNSLIPLVWAAKITNRPHYRLVAERCLRFYLLDNPLAFTGFSAYYAQVLWAMHQLGQSHRADKLVLNLPMTSNGDIPAFADTHTVCIPALLLFSQVYYGLGHPAMGRHLFERAMRHQHPKTGTFATLTQGPKAKEPSLLGMAWYLDALACHLQQQRLSQVTLLPDTLPHDDPRITWLCQQLQGTHTVLEVESGKGCYSTALMHSQIGQQWHVTELNQAALGQLTYPVQPREGAWAQLPYPNHTFDAVFGIDSLSQCINLPGALKEAARVLKPGGQLLFTEPTHNPQTPWRFGLTWAQWQNALTQAGYTLPQQTVLPSGYVAMQAQRA